MVARYGSDVPSPQTNDLGPPAMYCDYYGDLDGKASLDLADLNAHDEA